MGRAVTTGHNPPQTVNHCAGYKEANLLRSRYVQFLFPRPALFFSTAALFSLAAVFLWFDGASQLVFHLPTFARYAGKALPDSAWRFLQPDDLWFYCYFAALTALFATVWSFASPHPRQRWSVLGTALILFITGSMCMSASPSTPGTALLRSYSARAD